MRAPGDSHARCVRALGDTPHRPSLPLIAGKESTAAFGDGDAFQWQGLASDEAVCSKLADETEPVCAGPSGYVRDVYSAKDYRRVAAELQGANWLDLSTKIFTVRVQFVNAQSGCLVTAIGFFHQMPASTIRSEPILDAVCYRSVVDLLTGEARHERDELWSPGDFLLTEDVPLTQQLVYLLLLPYIISLILDTIRLLKNIRRVARKANMGFFVVNWLVAISSQLTIAAAVDLICLLSYLGMILGMLNFQAQVGEKINAYLALRHEALDAKGILPQVQAVFDELVAMKGVDGFAELASSGIRGLKSAVRLGSTWTPTPDLVSAAAEIAEIAGTATSTITGAPLHLDAVSTAKPFHDFRSVVSAHTAMATSRGFALIFTILRSMRYLRAMGWNLPYRLDALAVNGSGVVSYFVFLIHFQLAFAVPANQLFGAQMSPFSTIFSSLKSLLCERPPAAPLATRNAPLAPPPRAQEREPRSAPMTTMRRLPVRRVASRVLPPRDDRCMAYDRPVRHTSACQI